MPNNDTVFKSFARGHILGTARPLSEIRFITDSEAVNAVASTPKPRQHSIHILKGINERMSNSDASPEYRAEYLPLLAEFKDTFSADQDDIGHTDVTQHNIELPQGLMIRPSMVKTDLLSSTYN